MSIFQTISDKLKETSSQMPTLGSFAYKTEPKVSPYLATNALKSVGNFAKDILQGTARSGGSVGLSLMGEKELTPEDKTLASKIQKFIFGKEPLESISTRVEKLPARAKEFGIPEKVSKPFALPAILGLTALDFTGLGGESKALKTLAQTSDVKTIAGVLKKSGVADDLLETASKDISKITDTKQVKSYLDTLKSIIKAPIKGKLPTEIKTSEELRRIFKEETSKNPELKKTDFGSKLMKIYEDTQKKMGKKYDIYRNEWVSKSDVKTAIPPKQVATPPTPKIRPAVREEFGQAGKLSQLTPEPKIPESLKPEILTSETLTKPYTETTKKAIIDTAEAVEEHPSVVSRVADSLRKAKTSLVEYVQDADIRVKQLTEKKGVKIDDVSDPYLKMTLYHGRVGTKVENLKTEAKGIIDTMKKTANELKTDLKTIKKDVSDYLKFRHAPERNLALGERAAGITTKEAQEGLKIIETSANGKKVKEIADKLQKINDQTLDILKESGVISDDLYKTLRTKYKFHIPLNRIFEETEDLGSVLSGKGFDVKTTGIKVAKGSEREVADIMTNILTNQEQAIIRAEKNIVDQSTLAFTRQNKDILGDLITEIKPQAIGKTFEGKPLLERTQDPTILQLFENGKRVWIKIKDPELAIALKGVGKEKLGVILNAVAKFTRLYSGLATRFNPEFFLPNKIRDLQETAVYLASQKGVGFKGATTALRKDPESIKDVINAFRGIDNEGTRLYKEMRELGGTTGGMGLSTRKQVELNLERLEELANSKTGQIGNKLVEYIDVWNTIFEDSTRLSVYKSALKQGLSKDRAAFLAKEASINFNRMGKGGPVINALWMFSNASIQGSAKMIRSLKNPKVLGATVAVVGGAVATINEFNDQADEKWRDKVSKWDRLNGLPIVIPSTDGEFRYITIPVSWGLKPIKVLSEYAYDAISGNEFNAKNMIEDSITAIADAYNPVGGTDITSALVPTILDVPVDIARNRSWSGIKIRPDTDPNAPRDVQYFQSLGKTKIGRGAISISEISQDKLGLAISPADMKYAFDQYISGAGRTVGKFTNLIASATDDEPLPLDEYPLISRFYRERTAEEVGAGAGGETEDIKKILQEQSRERFTIKQQAQELDKELSKLPPAEANTRFNQIKKENPELAEKLKDIISERKLGLTYTEKLMKQLGVDNGERAKYIDEQIMKLSTREERNAYYQELRKKKIISDEVAKQIKELRK